MSLVGLITLVIFIMLCVKVGFGKGILWLLKKTVVSGLVTVLVTVVIGLIMGELAAKIAAILTAVIMFFICIKDARDQLK